MIDRPPTTKTDVGLARRIAQSPRRAARFITSSSVLNSALWLPYSVTMVAIVSAVVAQYAFHIPGDDKTGPTTLVRVGIAWLLAALLLSALTTLVAGPGNKLAQLGRGLLWWFVAPGRYWAWLIARIILLILSRPVFSFVLMALGGFAAVMTNGFQEFNPTLIVVAVIVLVGFSGITFGGRNWGNQYGSGVSGGTSGGCFTFIAMAMLAVMSFMVIMGTLATVVGLPAIFLYLGLEEVLPSPVARGVVAATTMITFVAIPLVRDWVEIADIPRRRPAKASQPSQRG